MAYLQTTIEGYEVSLDTDMNGDEETTGCWVTHGAYNASLAALQDTRRLDHATVDTTMVIPDSTIAKITEWAEANGY